MASLLPAIENSHRGVEFTLTVLRKQYPSGCTVVLVSMDDEFAPPKGTKGKVIHVDDIGSIHIAWETGSTLGVVPGVDMVRRLDEEIPTK